MEKFRAVFDFCLAHQKALGYGTVSLLTIGGERVFSDTIFKCPCNAWSVFYGLVFLLVPALILFLLGLLLSVQSWKVLTGCCAPGKLKRCCQWGFFLRNLQMLAMVIVGAAVSPLTWISVALLGGRFYECAASGNPILQAYVCEGKKNQTECSIQMIQAPCQQKTSKDMQEVLLVLQAQSQVIGWLLIATIFLIALVLTCIFRCRSPVSMLQLAFWKIYLEKERQIFEEKAKEHATKLAERNLKSFFNSTELEPFKTPSPKAWRGISSLFTFDPEEHYYSMIHKYVSCRSKSDSIKSEEADVIPACLNFVDAGGIAAEQMI
uniref:Calcium homeostasis modulator family member 6 n=1 Tax=Salvator merianae TaxID=96440 RepID=A0A8D0C1F5_SALMN